MEKEEVNGTTEEKAKPVAPPVPVRKAYLEALCGKTKLPAVGFDLRCGDGILCDLKGDKTSGFLVQKEDFASFNAADWEAASSPPYTPVPAYRESDSVDNEPSEEDKSVKVDSVAEVRDTDVKEERKSWVNEVADQAHIDVIVEEAPKAGIFPFEVQDVELPRDIAARLVPLYNVEADYKMDFTVERVPELTRTPLDKASLGYLFGTFEGLAQEQTEQRDPTSPTEPAASMPEVPVMEMPSGPQMEPETVETVEATTAVPHTDDSEGVRIQSHTLPLVELPTAATSDAPQQMSLDSFSKPADFRLDAGTQVLEMERPQPKEQTTFIAPAPKEEPASLNLMDAMRSEKPFAASMPIQDKPHQLQPLESASNIAKAYESRTENKKSEPLTSFVQSETRQPPHRQPTSITETKPVLDTEPSYGITSGPTPTLTSYQPPRHQPPHKLQDKSGPPVGVTGHPPNPKYGGHLAGAMVPAGQNAVHVPVSLNANSSGNPSLPLITQVPFLNPGMMPNAMAFPPATPYYPQFMQYHQHQMYHGMYAGAYSGFGAPFNHESVGHPAHGNPVGTRPPHSLPRPRSVCVGVVPPNQGNQQFPVSFPNAVYPLGNTVYDSNNPSSFSNNKEKDTVFLNQPQLPHAGFPGGPQPVVPRNEGVFYAVPGQAFSQGFRNQFHQPPGFAGQFPGGQFVTPPHTYHPPGQQGGNIRFH